MILPTPVAMLVSAWFYDKIRKEKFSTNRHSPKNRVFLDNLPYADTNEIPQYMLLQRHKNVMGALDQWLQVTSQP